VQQLTGVDASFLNMETAPQFGHVCSINVFAGDEGVEDAGFESTRARILERLHLLDPMRRRLVQVPFGLDHPYWINDPDFDIDYHVRQLTVPPPGDERRLADLVARLIGRPLDRSRPLWTLYVLDGLADGGIAHLNIVHHATIDGASGANLLTRLLDLSPDPGGEAPGGAASGPDGAPGWQPEAEPSPVEMLARTALHAVTRPRALARAQVRLLRQVASATRSDGLTGFADLLARGVPGPLGRPLRQRRSASREIDIAPVIPDRPAPRTSFNRAVTAHRRYALRTLPLDDAKIVRKAFGTTLNDVVMAACAGALRAYLEERDELPDDPLVAMVPVSVRAAGEAHIYSNRVSAIFAPLATNLADPVDRLLAISETMKASKETHDAIPATEMVSSLADFFPTAVAARAVRLISRTRIADRLNPPFNVTISNVPGPRTPLYLRRARLSHFYPVSTVADGSGLNITVQSCLDGLDFGVVTCEELVPDPWRIVDGIADELHVLHRAAVR
jgi:WS/DGAT/MGAT family acyltransferase